MDAIHKLDGSDSVDIIYDVKQTKQWYLPYNFFVSMVRSFFFAYDAYPTATQLEAYARAYLTFPYIHQHDLFIHQWKEINKENCIRWPYKGIWEGQIDRGGNQERRDIGTNR